MDARCSCLFLMTVFSGCMYFLLASCELQSALQKNSVAPT
jgi:hypothetical protein